MKDFPFFTTEYGISSLTLKEIPYKKTAYIQIRQVQPRGFREHLEACAGFCRMAGAETILAAGHKDLAAFPVHGTVLEMRGTAWVDPKKLACLFPVTGETAARWREIYNRRMAAVDNAATLEARDEQRLTRSTGAYFVHENGRLLGIGWLEGEELLAMAAVEPGAGARVLHSMMSLAEGARITLEVASTNLRAIRLYESAGFLKTKELSCWYRIHSAESLAPAETPAAIDGFFGV